VYTYEEKGKWDGQAKAQSIELNVVKITKSWKVLPPPQTCRASSYICEVVLLLQETNNTLKTEDALGTELRETGFAHARVVRREVDEPARGDAMVGHSSVYNKHGMFELEVRLRYVKVAAK